ncbi:MAG: MarR family transcriptional regulator [Acutalibacteraceae bacterium]|nr:MarR family transcriptional regulator [Acutalibacteraceae bacterium]
MDNESDKLISTRLRGLSHRIHRFFENSPNKKTIDSITGTHGWIIAFLACNKGKDVFQKDVEREFDVTRSTASKVIDLMEQKGLVTREKVPCDARLKKLVLTQKAQELSELFEKDRLLLEETLTQGFDDEEKRILCDFITRMNNNLQKSDKEE